MDDVIETTMSGCMEKKPKPGKPRAAKIASGEHGPAP
jgi:hypothetical protein